MRLEIPAPNPALTPFEIVKYTLDALQNNDLFRNDAGIEAAYRLISPLHRKALGPLHNFAASLKMEPLRDMIGFERAELDPMRLTYESAEQDVYLVRGQAVVSFKFYLSRQKEVPFADCWMTDAVLPRNC